MRKVEDASVTLMGLYHKYGTKGLELCTVEELKQECRNRDLKGFSSKTKPDLIDMVETELIKVSGKQRKRKRKNKEQKGVKHFVLKMILDKCWRSMQVPGSWKLQKALNKMLETGFGFDDLCHLFELTHNGITYATTFDDLSAYEWESTPKTRQKANKTLNEMGLMEGDSLPFLYDFGDNWMFTIYVEKEVYLPEEEFTILKKSKESPPPQYEDAT